jgi:hypothetical protein
VGAWSVLSTIVLEMVHAFGMTALNDTNVVPPEPLASKTFWAEFSAADVWAGETRLGRIQWVMASLAAMNPMRVMAIAGTVRRMTTPAPEVWQHPPSSAAR